ncbi:hypothetical protein L6164_017206 [Bauhinia variegata]|uniref:Uncharacterized protein n=1 Tax=Bauhinia variegata TaxID=167791 RepID=A0ACB9N8A6_BAUVA|nr:hypothetical protein L6164_017206 [Bauhinia variegata]
MCPWGLRAEKWSSLTMIQWFEFLSDDSDSIGISSKELLLFASVMMDKVWDERNRIAHASDSNHLDVLRVANSTLLNYFEMKNKLLPDIQEGSDDCPREWFKAYFDIAMTKEESWAAALLLNHEGKLLGARTRKLSTKFLLEQEALAAELAVELACDVAPKSNIYFEGVHPILHNHLNERNNKVVWYLEPIMADVRDKLGNIGDWEDKKVCRNFNWVAYNVAKWAAFCNSEGDVLNSVPAIQLLSKEDFVSSFFTIGEEVHDQDSLLNNSDNEDDDGLLRLKLKEVFTYEEDGINDNKKYDEGDQRGIKNMRKKSIFHRKVFPAPPEVRHCLLIRSKQSTRGQIPMKPLQIVHAFDANYAEGATELSLNPDGL